MHLFNTATVFFVVTLVGVEFSVSAFVALYEFHHLQDGRISHTWHIEDWFGNA